MTPFEIEVLLHYYAKAGDYVLPNEKLRFAWHDNEHRLISLQLLQTINTHMTKYAITDRGRAYVEGLMQVPLPERSVWTIP
jgi:hypothetical protein